MEKIKLMEVMEMASKATPRQFLRNFTELSELIKQQQARGEADPE